MEVLKINSTPALKQDKSTEHHEIKWKSQPEQNLYAASCSNNKNMTVTAERSILGSQELVRWSHHPIVAMTHRFRWRRKVPDCVNVRVQLFDGWFQKVYESFCDGIFSCSGLHHSHGGHFTSVDGEGRKRVTVTSESRGPLHFLLQAGRGSNSTILE